MFSNTYLFFSPIQIDIYTCVRASIIVPHTCQNKCSLSLRSSLGCLPHTSPYNKWFVVLVMMKLAHQCNQVVSPHYSERWMTSLSVSSAASSAVHLARAASQPSLPSCLQNPHTPFCQTQRRDPLPRAQPGRRACGPGAELRFQEVEARLLWRGDGSFT